MMISNLG